MHFPSITSSRTFDIETTYYKGLYNHGVDFRSNLFDLKSIGLSAGSISKIEEQARSIACFIDARLIVLQEGRDQFDLALPTLAMRMEKREQTTLGEEENFSAEPSVASGTAFLITDKLILTAAHNVCEGTTGQIDEIKLKTLRIVFNFRMINKEQCQRHFAKDNVYSMKKVVAYQLIKKTDNYQDWALIKLDRKVVNRTPLQMDFSKQIVNNTQLYMLGYPMGLPIKYTRNGYVKKSDHPNVFEANLDAFSGNSGSPILDEEGTVVGLLSRGSDDYEKVDNYKGTGNSRMQVHCIEESKISKYEICQKISSLLFVKDYMNQHRSVDQGFLAAQYIGIRYMESVGNPRNTSTAAELFYKLEDPFYEKRNSLGRLYFLGRILINSSLIPEKKRGLACLEQAAMDALAEARYFLGWFHTAHQNYAEGFKWFKMGADDNDPLCVECLGAYYSNGLFVSKDEKVAFEYYQQAALLSLLAYNNFAHIQKVDIYYSKDRMEQRYRACQYRMGLYYVEGNVVRQNYPLAFHYLKNAPDWRNARVLYICGMGYLEGWGCAPAPDEAIKYLQAAADANDREAQYQLGLCHLKGIETKKNKTQALFYFQNAAKKEHQLAIHIVKTAEEKLRMASQLNDRTIEAAPITIEERKIKYFNNTSCLII